MSSFEDPQHDAVTSDHPEVGKWPEDAWTEWEPWRFFRGRSMPEHSISIALGIIVPTVIYLVTLWITGKWQTAVVFREAETHSIRFIAMLLGGLVCQLYYGIATIKAYGQWFLNFTIFPIISTIVGIYISDKLFTKDAGVGVYPFGGELGSISSPAYVIDMMVFVTPIVILSWILHHVLRYWAVNNPQRAKSWEEEHMHVAIISYWIEKLGE